MIFDGLPDPQRNAAFRAAPSAAAPSVQRVDVAADIIARAQRQLEAAAPPVGMAPSLAAGPPQRHEENAVQARRQRSAAAPRVNVASVAAAAPPQHHNVPENVAAAPPPPPPPPPAPVPLLLPPNNVNDEAAGDYEGEGEDLANYFDVNDVSPDVEDDGDDENTPADAVPLSGERSAAETFFIEGGNDVKALFAMGVGLKNDDGSPFSDWEHKAFDKGERKAIKPANAHLVAEQCRRRKEGGEANPLFNKQVVRQKLLDYLLKQPITNAADVSFIKGEILSLITKAQAVEQRQNIQDTRRWSGPAPYQRLCHAVTDIPENKVAFEDSFRASTREEVDGRNNPETARPKTWDMIQDVLYDLRCIVLRIRGWTIDT